MLVEIMVESRVWVTGIVTVCVAGAGAAEVPPSTGTTEYVAGLRGRRAFSVSRKENSG